jgi:adenylate cyclase
VLFSDIRSFTTLTEQYAPEEIVEMLNDYMTEMEAVIERHSGSIEKYIGDAIMAVFLPELGRAAPPQRAAEAAVEMGLALHAFNRKRAQAGRFVVKNGVGIATGELLMGSMGNLQGQQRYTVTGATVNLAAEMEKVSKQAAAMPIVMCPTTAGAVAVSGFTLIPMQASPNAYEFRIVA